MAGHVRNDDWMSSCRGTSLVFDLPTQQTPAHGGWASKEANGGLVLPRAVSDPGAYQHSSTIVTALSWLLFSHKRQDVAVKATDAPRHAYLGLQRLRRQMQGPATCSLWVEAFAAKRNKQRSLVLALTCW